jgi:HSP20 family protein
MFSRFALSENPFFNELRQFERQLDDLVSGGTGWSGGIRSLPPGTFPAINVASTDDGLVVYVFAPGVDPKSLDIQLQQNVLSITGKREVPVEKGATYYRQERFSGEFRRTLTLPDDIDPEKVEAACRDGIVTISVKRRESAKPRQIPVH